jgi:hypothetical protein
MWQVQIDFVLNVDAQERKNAWQLGDVGGAAPGLGPLRVVRHCHLISGYSARANAR